MHNNIKSIQDNVTPDAVAHYQNRGLNPYRVDAINRYAIGSILDVGCGSGAYVLHFSATHDIRGVDYKFFDSWKSMPELFELSDATSIGISDDSVDTILLFETLEHLADPRKALDEYFRIARKRIILTVPNCIITPGLKHSNLIYSHWSDPTHVNFYNMSSIVSAVEDAGFRIIHNDYINRINMGPAVMEVIGLSGVMARIGARIFRMIQRRPHYITTLVVGEKH